MGAVFIRREKRCTVVHNLPKPSSADPSGHAPKPVKKCAHRCSPAPSGISKRQIPKTKTIRRQRPPHRPGARPRTVKTEALCVRAALGRGIAKQIHQKMSSRKRTPRSADTTALTRSCSRGVLQVVGVVPLATGRAGFANAQGNQPAPDAFNLHGIIRRGKILLPNPRRFSRVVHFPVLARDAGLRLSAKRGP